MARTKRKNTSAGGRPKKRRRGGKAQHTDTAKLTLSERTARHCRQFDPACEHLLKLDSKTLKLQLRKKKAALKKGRGELAQLQSSASGMEERHKICGCGHKNFSSSKNFHLFSTDPEPRCLLYSLSWHIH